jgi:hypothetical protein
VREAPRAARIALPVLASGLYFAVAGLFADRKLLWTDELFTVYIASQRTVAGVIDGLLNGPDVLPPLNYLATRLAISVFGASHFAYRAAPMVGYWLALTSAYLFVRRRHEQRAAWCASLFLLVVPAFAFAYEARPYGLMAGFTGLAMVCWQRLGSRGTWYWFAGLVLGLSGSVLSHWYGVLTLFPIAIGQVVRSRKVEQESVATGVALVLATFTLVLLRPFASQALTFRGMVPPPSNIAAYLDGAYQLIASGPIVVTLLALGLAGGVIRVRDRRHRAEVACAVAAAMIPIAGFLIANLTAGQSLPRYVLHGSFGVAVLFGMLIGELTNGRARLQTAAAVCMLALALVEIGVRKQALEERSMIGEHKAQFALLGVPASRLESLPIVVADIDTYLQLHFYGTADSDHSLRYALNLNPMAKKNMINLARFENVKIIDRSELLTSTPDFYVYELSGRDPLLPSLLAGGGIVSDSGVIDTRDIYPRPGRLYRVSTQAKPKATP